MSIVLAAFGGVLVAGELGLAETNNPVDILMRIERFYREDLANKYAPLEMSDRRLKNAASSIHNFFVRKESVLIELEQSVDPRVEGVVRDFDWYTGKLVNNTYLLFTSLYNISNLLESKRGLTTVLEKMGVFYNIGKIIYTPMNQVRMGAYVRLLNDTNDTMGDWIRSGRIKELLSGMEEKEETYDAAVDLRGLIGVALESLGEMYAIAVRFNNECESRLKQRCTWMLHSFVEEGKTSVYNADITLPLFFNDVAALIHRHAEFVNQLTPAGKIQIGHITIRYTDDSDPALLRAVKAWATTVTMLERRGWPYQRGDLEPLRGTVVTDYAWMRVGSSPGHATHIKREGGLFIVRYYDNDMPVNELFGKLISEYVPRAEVNMLSGGVEIKVSNEVDLIKVTKLLAFVTSLDILLEKYGKETIEKRIKRTIEGLNILALSR